MFKRLTKIGRKLSARFRKTPTSDSRCAVILCAPSYDEITRHTRDWVQAITVSADREYVLLGSDANRAQMIRCLEETKGYKRIKIFLGHGVPDALLGAPEKSGSHARDYGGEKHEAIYDLELINMVPSALFAFSCRSGLELGKRFCLIEGRNFLGYVDYVPLDVINKECAQTWKTIVGTISSEIIRDRDVLPKHETRLKDLYYEALMYFHQHQGKNNDEAFLMMMYLLHHQNNLRLYRGPTNVPNH